jgi:hypothetical protein
MIVSAARKICRWSTRGERPFSRAIVLANPEPRKEMVKQAASHCSMSRHKGLTRDGVAALAAKDTSRIDVEQMISKRYRLQLAAQLN